MKKSNIAIIAVIFTGLSFSSFAKDKDSPIQTQMKEIKKLYKKMTKEKDLANLATEAEEFEQAIKKAKEIGLNKNHEPTEKDIKVFEDHLDNTLKNAKVLKEAAKNDDKFGADAALDKIKNERNEAHKYFDVN